MPKLFCALRCLRKKDEDIRLFRIPADGFQRKQWIAAIGFIRTSPHCRICNKHFVTGTLGDREKKKRFFCVLSSVKHSVTELGTPKKFPYNT